MRPGSIGRVNRGKTNGEKKKTTLKPIQKAKGGASSQRKRPLLGKRR